ncbi:MAG: transcription termination factor NusA, partial [Verrucomicrobia bacterium]
EAVMPQRERVVVEDYNVGDRLRAYVVAVENGLRGPEIIVSRSHPKFVRRLFELEVSEIADGTVEIRGIAREAGYRTKIAVWSANDKVDPVGACVGMRGSRVKNIVRELNNEKVDIIRWSSDPKDFILEALKPAKVKAINFDLEKKAAQISVDEDQLSLAIGKKGQNARLTSRLTGWEINIDKDTSATTAVEQKVAQAAQTLAKELPITEEQAVSLVKSGFTNLEGLHAADVSDLVDILGVDEAKAQEIHDAVHKQDTKQEAAGSAQPG